MSDDASLTLDEQPATPTSVTDEMPPPLDVRWMRPTSSSAILELPTAPVTLSNSPKDISWLAFTAEESAGCETAWQDMSEEKKKLAEEDEDPDVSKQHEEDEEDDDETVGVSIAEDKLFEVDVRSKHSSAMIIIPLRS